MFKFHTSIRPSKNQFSFPVTHPSKKNMVEKEKNDALSAKIKYFLHRLCPNSGVTGNHIYFKWFRTVCVEVTTLSMRIGPQNNSRNTQLKKEYSPYLRSYHFDRTVHTAACLHTGIATHQVLELRTRHTSNQNMKKRIFALKRNDVIEICRIYRHSRAYVWRKLVFCQVLRRYGFH